MLVDGIDQKSGSVDLLMRGSDLPVGAGDSPVALAGLRAHSRDIGTSAGRAALNQGRR